METAGKLLMAVGVFVTVVGAALYFSKYIPWLGRLPGDIVIVRPNFTLYLPLATSLLLSLLLSALLYLLSKLR